MYIQTMNGQGRIRKMRTELDGNDVVYTLPMGDQLLAINSLIGKQLRLQFTGNIQCVACGRAIKKSFQQGYCFPCMRRLPECDQCIVRPELCHFDQGTCRDEAWGQTHCMQDHFLYLANSSGLKVGITRGSQIPTRWMDQGATQALPIIRASSRFAIGQLEVALKAYVNDRTDWRKMLKGTAEPLDLLTQKHQLLMRAEESLGSVDGQLAWNVLEDQAVVEFNYPVLEYPEKINSINLDKVPEIDGFLQGIKGQYLIFDVGVMNVRKYGGYEIQLNAERV